MLRDCLMQLVGGFRQGSVENFIFVWKWVVKHLHPRIVTVAQIELV